MPRPGERRRRHAYSTKVELRGADAPGALMKGRRLCAQGYIPWSRYMTTDRSLLIARARPPPEWRRELRDSTEKCAAQTRCGLRSAKEDNADNEKRKGGRVKRDDPAARKKERATLK